VLDFGAGSGVAGLAAARSGARVTAADIDPVATLATELNAELNGVSVETTTRDLVGTECRWDVVLFGDVTYEARFSRRLLRWANQLAQDGALVLIGDPGRGHLDRRSLREVAKYEMQSEDEPGTRHVNVRVYLAGRALEEGSHFR
jgi:predicted nicotinamide N-methyase